MFLEGKYDVLRVIVVFGVEISEFKYVWMVFGVKVGDLVKD